MAANGETQEKVGRLEGKTEALNDWMERMESAMIAGFKEMGRKFDAQAKACNSRFIDLEIPEAIDTKRWDAVGKFVSIVFKCGVAAVLGYLLVSK